ncbi:MAG: hypothetical protein AB7O24_13200 [Kofleriaceae bacterium]
MTTTRAAVRAYARYVVPMTVLSVLAFTPLIAIAVASAPPHNLAGATATIRIAWLFGAVAWMPVLALVAAAAHVISSPGSQLDVLRGGGAVLVKSAPACGAAIAAIVIGGAALVVPGVMLLVLFATTGATASGELSDRLTTGAAIARTQWRSIAIVVALTLVAQLAIVYLAQRFGAPLPLPKKPNVLQLAAVQRSLWIAIAGLIVTAPISAIALACIHVNARPASADYSTSVQHPG